MEGREAEGVKEGEGWGMGVWKGHGGKDIKTKWVTGGKGMKE